MIFHRWRRKNVGGRTSSVPVLVPPTLMPSLGSTFEATVENWDRKRRPLDRAGPIGRRSWYGRRPRRSFSARKTRGRSLSSGMDKERALPRTPRWTVAAVVIAGTVATGCMAPASADDLNGAAAGAGG